MRGNRATVLLAVWAAVLALATACDGGGVPGITATEIKLGSHRPTVGAAGVNWGECAYFAYVNEELGGVCGRKIVLKIESDQYTPSQAVEAVRRLVEDEEVFAILGGLGTATSAAVYKDLNDEGIPDMYITSGSSLFVEDPQTYRYVFGGMPSYLTVEGPVMGEFIARSFPDANVGFFIQNDDFGRETANGVMEGIAGRNEIVQTQAYSTSNPDIRALVANLRDSEAEVVAMAAIPEFAASFLQIARGQGWDVPVVANSAIADPIIFLLAGADNVSNMWAPTYLVSPSETGQPGIQEYLRVMEAYAPNVPDVDAPDPDPARSYNEYGYAVAQLMTETIRRACDDLTRDGLVQAAESIRSWDQPVAWGPVSMNPTDHGPWDTFRWTKAENGQWVPFGDIVSRESMQ